MAHEGIAFVGRGNNISLRNTVKIGFASYPPRPEARSNLLVKEHHRLRRRSFSEAECTLLGVFYGHGPTQSLEVFFGRNLIHGFHNIGQSSLNLIGFFNPPGIEDALSETGVPRKLGEP